MRLRRGTGPIADQTESTHHRNPALDGIRGFAVACVVVGHWWPAHFSKDGPVSTAFLSVINGGTGVLIFFVLSGYLITGIIARERARTGTISLYNFYVRRTLRIMPAFYFFLAVMAITSYLGYTPIPGGDFAASGAYLWNYMHLWRDPTATWFSSWWLGHTWSLAVEEQFYLLWPLTLLLLKPKRAFLIAVSYSAVVPVLRVATYVFQPDSRGQIGLMFHTRADSLLIGCAAALLPYVYPDAWARLRAWIRRTPVEVPALALVVVSNVLKLAFGGAWNLAFGYTLTSLGVVILLVAVVEKRDAWLARALGWRPLVLLGLISYSLYLWQQPFLYDDMDPPFFVGQWWSLPAALVAATASYWIVEKPFLRLKGRLQRSTSHPATVDLNAAPGPTVDVREANAPASGAR